MTIKTIQMFKYLKFVWVVVRALSKKEVPAKWKVLQYNCRLYESDKVMASAKGKACNTTAVSMRATM